MVARGEAQRNPWNTPTRCELQPRSGNRTRPSVAALRLSSLGCAAFQGLRCASPLATTGRRSAASSNHCDSFAAQPSIA